MPSEILEVLMTSSQDTDGGLTDPFMVLAKTSPVQMNSGIQNVFPHVINAIARAKLLRPPYRDIAINSAKSALYGIASIGSENGAYLKELNTQRTSQSINMGQARGQPASAFDKYLYGKDHLANNPKGKDESMMF